MKVTLFTCDKYLWCLRPFAYLFNKYWSHEEEVLVFGYKVPDFDLPDNFSFYSISPREYPADIWSSGVSIGLRLLKDRNVVIFLEDYFLKRKVDVDLVHKLDDYMYLDESVLSIDLSGYRLSLKNAIPYSIAGYDDLVKSPHGSAYQMNFQVCMWNRELLLYHMLGRESPWQAEIHGTERLNKLGDRGPTVLGSTRKITDYEIAMRKAHQDRVLGLERLDPADADYIRNQGWLPWHVT